MAALQKNRVNHAYLFSGPRGCGKTTSARILARCLNCAEGPTPVPCGKCDSCVELARNGSGSLDVIEIDAASHGGVDDARDLRERATFAPVRDRYKIFIIDEAHMVTSAGFNALLKIVEEPPEHIKFIFATTEPDKVIGTIRSRTHHYPFRLVPPEPLLAYLESLCKQENVPVAPGVLSLVIRAGGGSVRDSLSVLDQLMAGAGPEGLDYELAVALLGYTHISLLDDVVDAFAAGDSATVFRAVDRVIQTGQDPRRFVEDLLERFRDLIIVNAMPDSAAAVLRGTPEDQISRMSTQAGQMGGAELSRAADITNTALNEMTGATSPRLHLELLCARILLPAADQSERGTAARVERLERRLSYAGDPSEARGRAEAAESPVKSIPAASPTATQAASTAPAVDEAPSGPSGVDFAAAPPSDVLAAEEKPAAPGASLDWGGTWSTPQETSPQGAGPQEQQPAQQPAAQAAPAGQPARQEAPRASAPQSAAPQSPAAQSAPQPPVPQQGAGRAPAAAPSAGGQVEMIRRAWPEIMDALTGIRRATWLNVSKNATPRAFDGKVLELAFSNPGAATNFNRPDHLDNLRKAIHQVLGLDCQVNPIHDSSASAGESGPKAGSRPPTAPAPTEKQSGPPATVPSPVQGRTPAAASPVAAPAAAAAATRASAPANPATGVANPATGATGTAGMPGPAGVPDGAAAALRRRTAAGQPVPSQDRSSAGGSASNGSAPPNNASNGSAPTGPGMPRAAAAAPAGRHAAGPLPEDWQQEPSDPYADVPESNAWETSEPPADIDSGGHLSDSEWANTDWAGIGSTPARPRGAGTPAAVTAAGAGPSSASASAASAPPASAPPAAAAPGAGPQAPGGDRSGRPLSRYQKLLNEAAQRGGSAPPPGRGKVDSTYVEDIPSADDVTLEDSGLVGRRAIERILGGRLVEERSLDGR